MPQRRFFSLIEILIALAILVSLLGIVGFNIKAALRSQSYDSQVDRLVSELNLSQDMLLVFNIETEFRFSPQEAHLVPVGTLDQAYERLIEREHTSLSALASVHFEGTLGERLERTFSLKFLDAGFETPKGVLTLTSLDGEKSYIYLPGYPAPLARQSKAPAIQVMDQQERLFYEKLTASTWATIHDHTKK